MTTQINDMTPVIIGVGQFQMDVPTSLDNAPGPTEITAHAIEAALKDANIEAFKGQIDRVTAIRLFGDMGPVFPCPFGTPSCTPMSISAAAGLTPKTLIYSRMGGEQPQVHIAETVKSISHGETDIAVVCGGEAMATMKAATRQGVKLDWSSGPEPTNEIEYVDEGFDFSDLPIAPEELRHGLINPIFMYAMMETAQRLRLGLSVETYQQEISELFAPFSAIASENPFAMFKEKLSEEYIRTPSDANPFLASPYTKAMVAKDSVNQGAAIILTTVKKAREMRVPENKWVFLKGYACGEEPLVCRRPNIDRFPVLEQVIHSAFESAALKQSDIKKADFYSCFPIVVFNASEMLSETQIEHYTLTGGLPFFGGPGNNYSLHAIAEMVEALRGTKDYGLIHANGGVMTKHAVGIYSTHPGVLSDFQTSAKAETKPINFAPTGSGKLLSYCLKYKKNAPTEATVLVSMKNGDNALALFEGDLAVLDKLSLHHPMSIEPGKRHNIARLA